MHDNPDSATFFALANMLDVIAPGWRVDEVGSEEGEFYISIEKETHGGHIRLTLTETLVEEVPPAEAEG